MHTESAVPSHSEIGFELGYIGSPSRIDDDPPERPRNEFCQSRGEFLCHVGLFMCHESKIGCTDFVAYGAFIDTKCEGGPVPLSPFCLHVLSSL